MSGKAANLRERLEAVMRADESRVFATLILLPRIFNFAGEALHDVCQGRRLGKAVVDPRLRRPDASVCGVP